MFRHSSRKVMTLAFLWISHNATGNRKETARDPSEYSVVLGKDINWRTTEISAGSETTRNHAVRRIE